MQIVLGPFELMIRIFVFGVSISCAALECDTGQQGRVLKWIRNDAKYRNYGTKKFPPVGIVLCFAALAAFAKAKTRVRCGSQSATNR